MIRTISEKALKSYAWKVVARRRGFSLTKAYQMFPMKYFLRIVYYVTLIEAEQNQKQLLNLNSLFFLNEVQEFNKLEKKFIEIFPQLFSGEYNEEGDMIISKKVTEKYLKLRKQNLELSIRISEKKIQLTKWHLMNVDIGIEDNNIQVTLMELENINNILQQIQTGGGQA